MNDVPTIQAAVLKLEGRYKFSLLDRLSGFLSLIRPLFFILTPINAAGAAVLALGGFPPVEECVFGFLAVAFASCAVNVFNDFIDRDRDKKIWPTRALPSGRIKPVEALLVVIFSLAFSLSIAWLVFNPATFYILLLALVLGALYSAYLRDKIGYLSLPPIVGLIYLGGWAAFSPETLFSNWLPWYLYLLGVVWQTAHIMVYYPQHLNDGSKPKAFFFSPSPQAAVTIGVAFTGLAVALALLLPLAAPFSGVLYIILVTAAGAYALFTGLRLSKNSLDRGRGIRAFTSLSVFRLVISVAILLSIFLARTGWA